MKERRVTGTWWTPGSDQKRTGTLTCTHAEGIDLRIMDSFPGRTLDTTSPVVVLGHTADGEHVTLTNGFQTSERPGSPDAYQEFHFRLALFGQRHYLAHDLRFAQFKIGYTHLPEWVATQGFEPTYSVKEGRPRRYAMRYKFPRSRFYPSKRCAVTVRHGFQTDGHAYRRLELRHNVELLIEPPAPLSVHQFLETIGGPIQSLLTLATDRPNAYSMLEAAAGHDGDKALLNHTASAEVFFHPIYAAPAETKVVYPHEMLFTLADMGRATKWLQNWFDTADRVRSAFNVYFATRYNPSAYVDERFLAHMQVIESLDRAYARNYELSPKQHERRLNQILDSAPTRHRAWLQERLAYSNEPRLRSRLTRMMNEVGAPVLQLIRKPRTFIQRAVVTRNHLVHRTRAARDTLAPLEMAHYTDVLGYLIKSWFLLRLRFKKKDLQGLWDKNRRYGAFKAQKAPVG